VVKTGHNPAASGLSESPYTQPGEYHAASLSLSAQDKQILRDAIGEYIARRSPAKQYVEKRYPECIYGTKFKEEKVKTTNQNIIRADQLLVEFHAD